jgi:hypothetical protein
MFKRPSSAELPKTDDLSGDHWNRKHTSVITKVSKLPVWKKDMPHKK